MKLLDQTFPTPEENLACDEALLELCEKGFDQEILRLWEPKEYFVVLGIANKVEKNVNVSACTAEKIPLIRRPSGGGTVLQGPGCFNFSLILKIDSRDELRNITSTTCHILKQNTEALASLTKQKIEQKGQSDLVIEKCKFSGNAQCRKRHFVLFHGSFLLDFNISLIEKYLSFPERQPDYRQDRSHTNFLVNLDISQEKIKEALQEKWGAKTRFEEIPSSRINQLIQEKYSQDSWNLKF